MVPTRGQSRRERTPRQKEYRKMHPAIMEWWQARRAEECGGWGEGAGASAGCGPGGGRGGGHRGWGRHFHPGETRGASGADDGDGDGGGHFGVRRPLRFLAYKLDLDERQVGELARILDVLKTERAQAEVDRRRTVSALADAIAGDAFDGAKADEGAKLRVSSAERLRDAVIQALQQIHAILDAEQRAKLAYLIRTGTLSIWVRSPRRVREFLLGGSAPHACRVDSIIETRLSRAR